jgi:hypothetical protein
MTFPHSPVGIVLGPVRAGIHGLGGGLLKPYDPAFRLYSLTLRTYLQACGLIPALKR